MLGSRFARTAALSKHARAMSLANPQPEQGILESIFGKSKMPQVPLHEAFPEADLPAIDSSNAVQSYERSITTLDNGLRVVSVDSNNPIAGVGVFVDAGSRNENFYNSGISHFLEHVAFRSTTNRSGFKMNKNLSAVGASLACAASRDHTMYAAEAMREHVPALVGALADVVQNPLFDEDEMRESHEQYREQLKLAANPEIKLNEAIHAAAYHNNTLGLPLYGKLNKTFTTEQLRDHFKLYTADRMVVSGVGMDHDELVQLARTNFKNLKGGEAVVETPNYTGGDVRIMDKEEGYCHLALGFETASWRNEDVYAVHVLQMMMGGGGSFSAGGPGKGMYSRMYQNVLNQHPWVENANSFASVFTDSGIFGLTGMCPPEGGSSMVDVLSNELVRMTAEVSDAELARSKAQLKSQVHMQLEQRALVLEDIGRQLLTDNKVQTAAETCAKIDAVSGADVKRVAATMLKTPLSMASYGNVGYVPRYADIAKRFG